MDKTGKLHLSDQGIDNMTNLVELSDQSLLSNLQVRYSQKLIYTYIGSILISINPYTELGIYDKKYIVSYQNKLIQDMPPHLFGIGETNYTKMMRDNENQVIVISGESGAGKTESFKRLLKYFAYVSGGFKEVKQNSDQLSNDIATRILDSTPLLESFGNAQTIRNDNSSRFGKYVEIFFDNGNICGSRITNYLLEKSRIVNINPRERGYHIFYEVLLGLDSFNKSQYYFKDIKDYSYLSNSKEFTIKDRNDAANLKEFMNQWDSLGLTSEDLDVAMRILSAVLHLGNIKFMEEQEASYLVETENIGIVSKMLKIDHESLKQCLTMKTTETVKDASISPLNMEQSINYRDTLSKHLYSELFNWIVTKVNAGLNQNNLPVRRQSVVDRSLLSAGSTFRSIAMLDIYGFENFPDNSLEQLCINYANETLQQFFNRYVFQLEQEEYKKEGISWHYIAYPDNQPIIDLLSSKPNGIIQILNDECSIPQGSDVSFLNKCHNVHGKNENYEKPKKTHPPQFIIHHFAGNISYSVTGFLEKNRDVLRKEILNIIENCEVIEIATMFRKKRELQTKNPTAKARTPAVMGDFQNSLTTLLAKMKTCQPWFIRCLKPNTTKEALKFNKDIVMDQMKYTGILETVKIRKSGFPIQILFSVFLSRFYLLVTKEIRKASLQGQQEACLKLMIKFKGVKNKHFELGKTKLFLKEDFARHLEKQVQIIRNRSAVTIQRKWRAYWKIRLVIIQNQAATKIQSIVRGFIDRRRIRKLHIGIVKLQAFVRMQIARKKFLRAHPSFTKLSIYNKPIEPKGQDNSKLTAYKAPVSGILKKGKKNKKKTSIGNAFNYDLLKIPIELAFLLDKTEGGKLSSEFSQPFQEQVIQTGRAQHLWNRGEYKLPKDIDFFVLENFLDDYGNHIPFESKSRPLTIPYLNENVSQDHKDDSLTAHKLILRIMYSKSMPWFHKFLTNSYLQFLGMKSSDLQKEILVQILAETLPSKSIRTKYQSDHEEIRLTRAWTLLGNFLSFIIPSPDIYNYVLKFVSDCIGVDQANTCQEKLLQFASSGHPQIPRLFPATNLECSANKKGSKTCLNVFHPDYKSNSVHINSFTVGEDLASHSLCFRMKRFKLMKGWSVSVIYSDRVYDCSGQNYVLDIISALELPQHWSEITGQVLEQHFLMSKRHRLNGDIVENATRGYVKTVSKPQGITFNKGPSTVNSLHSMDTWVEQVFESSFRNEDVANTPVQDFIHGLEDELRAKGHNHYSSNPTLAANFTHSLDGLNSNPNLAFGGHGNLHYSTDYLLPRPGPNNSSMYFPAAPITNDFDMLQDPTYLQEQLNSVQLENKVIQSSIEREILQSRLQKIKQQKYYQQPGLNPNIPMQYHQQYLPHQVSMPNYSIVQPTSRFPTYPHYHQQQYPHQFLNSEQFSNSPTGGPHFHQTNPLSNSQPHIHTDNNQIQHVHSMSLDQADSRPITQIPPNKETVQEKDSKIIDLQNIKLKKIPTSVAAPPVPPPPPPPPPPPAPNGHMPNNDSNEQTESGEKIVPKRRNSIVKYSEVGNPSTTVVDDKDVLPAEKLQEDKKSYMRAAEVPKVNVTNRAAFLENFFKEKPPPGVDPTIQGKKRKVPALTVEETKFPENQANAINLLASMNPPKNLLPRPSMSGGKLQEIKLNKVKLPKPKPQVSISDKKDEIMFETQLPRTNINTIKTETVPVPLPRNLNQTEKLLKPITMKPRKYVSNTKADILCGLPDMRYYTYQKVPWTCMLKREIYLPNEIQNTTIMNPMIFCQIVRDLIEFPCIRWIGNEKRKLLSLIGNRVTTDINSILAVPTNTMLKVIDETLKCELYFSRFYEIKWVKMPEVGSTYHWMSISHSGVRFVYQNSKSSENELMIGSHILYSNIDKVTCKSPDQYNNLQIMTITTKPGKKFKIKTIHADSARKLIMEFSEQQKIEQSHGTINLASNLNNKKRTRNLLNEAVPFTDSGPMMLGVNNQRIQFPSHSNSSNIYKNIDRSVDTEKIYDKVKKQGNLIDFTMSFSKYKDRQHVSNVILRWQQDPIKEPILQSSNDGIIRQAMEIHNFLLLFTDDISSGRNPNPINSANLIFKMLLQNEELNEEIFVQVFKQINGNPSIKSRNYLWNFLSILIMFIGVNQRMQPFLLEHLNQIIKNVSNEDQHLAAFALKNYKIFSKFGPRKALLLDNEFDQLMKGAREMNTSILVPNDPNQFNIPFNATVEDVIRIISETLDITSKLEITEYSLIIFEMTKSGPAKTATNYLLFDNFYFDEINPLLKQKNTNLSIKFLRTSWVSPLNLDYRTQNFVSFHFNQLSKGILDEDWLVPLKNQSSDAVELSTISKIAYYNLRGQGLSKLKNDDSLKSLLPGKLLDQKKKTISKKSIMKNIKSESEEKQALGINEFQKLFLEYCEKLPRFGLIKCQITDVKPLTKPGQYFIVFSSNSISLVENESQEQIMDFLISEFRSFQVSVENSTKFHFILRYRNEEEIQFDSIYGEKLKVLLIQYEMIKRLRLIEK